LLGNKIESEKSTDEPSRGAKKYRILWMAGIVVTLMLLVIALRFSSGGGVSVKHEAVSYKNISTYLSKNSDDIDKRAQSKFQAGDPIQIGFQYELLQEDERLIRVLVVNRANGEEVTRTNLFRINKSEGELFVSVNNGSLPASKYVAKIVTEDDQEIASIGYEILQP